MISSPAAHRAAVDIGIDLGGTGTRIVGVDPDGTVIDQRNFPTMSGDAGGIRAVDALAAAIIDLSAERTIRSVGIGASGPVDSGGIVRNPATLPAYSNIPITTLLSERFDVPCAIDNDAVTAAIGEHTYGAGRDSACLLVVTLGTGIGVALLNHGIPYRAGDGSHPEAGHIATNGPPAPCYCGLDTCWEQLASRTALETLLHDDPTIVARRAYEGDARSKQNFTTYGQRVGTGLSTLLTMFRPDRVVLGGGAARYLDLFNTGIHSVNRTAEYDYPYTLVSSDLGNVAGAIGAALIGRRQAIKHESGYGPPV